MSTPLGANKLAQVAFVVRDIEAAKVRWAAVLGVEPPNTIVTAPGHEARQTHRGQPSDAQAKLCFFDLGGVQLELIEPMGGESTWQEALDQNGEGFHHIAFWVENMPASAEGLKAHGIERIQRGDMGGGGQYGYFDATQPLACVIELLERDRTEFSD
ncbi:MAG TPA: VOC family protein [Fimbriimonadaceae bacterium]|nr:VOC family protein [Fimbriimonadaceae bacterium]